MNYTVPALSDCAPNIEPFEFQVLIAPAVVQEKSKGGIILAPDTKDAQQFRSDHARLVAISPAAFSYHRDWPPGTRFPQVGDEVFVPKFSGEEIIGKDGQKYRLCADKDIKAVIERAPTPHDLLNAQHAETLSALTVAIEGLFGEIGDDQTSWMTPARGQWVVFANGEFKEEGAPVAEMPSDLVGAMVAAVKDKFPDAAQARLYWRRRPDVRHTPAYEDEPARTTISIRIGADAISQPAAKELAHG